MRILLRFVAAYTLLTVLLTVRLVAHFWHQGDILPILKSGPVGILTLAGWLITFVVGVPAAVLLWRMKDAGRIATAVVFGSIGFYYLFGLIFIHNPQTLHAKVLAEIVFSGVLVAVILSPAAGRLCRSQGDRDGSAL